MKIISIDTETAFDIPFIATTCTQNMQTTLYDLKNSKQYNVLKDICNDSNIIKVFHNASYDIYALFNIGISVVPPIEDTMIAASLLNENYESKKLKSLAKIYLGEQCLEDKKLSKIKSKYKREAKKTGKVFTYADIPPKILYPYAKKDAEYTISLWKLFSNKIVKYQKIYDIEKELVYVVVDMVSNGFRIDRAFVKDKILDCKHQIKKMYGIMCNILESKNIYFYKKVKRKTERGIESYIERNKIHKYKLKKKKNGYILKYVVDFLSSSQHHLSNAIDKLNIPITSRTKNGLISTNFDTLIKHKDTHKFIDYILQFRFFNKQLTTYYKPLYYRYTNKKNSTARFMFYSSGAKTGRFTAKLIQTIPRMEEDEFVKKENEVRRAFVPRKGYYILSADYKQIEFRLFAHFSKCKSLIDDINNGFDPHLGTAIRLFGKNKVNTNKKYYRKIAKDINFGIIYGMGSKKLAKSLGLPLGEAYRVLEDYHRMYPIKEFTRKLSGTLYRKGFISLYLQSSLMHFNRDYRIPQEYAYRAINSLIQGTAAYVMKCGMLRAYKWIKHEKTDIRLLGTLHDELIWEISKDEDIDYVLKGIAKNMEDYETFSVPMTVDMKISDKSWGDVK